MSTIKEAPDDINHVVDTSKFNGDMIKQPDGTVKFYKRGKLHRDDGPAVIYYDGTQYYYKNGKLHRDDGPAVIRPNGIKDYYKNGKLLEYQYENTVYPINGKQFYIDGENEYPVEEEVVDKGKIFVYVMEYKDGSQTLFSDRNEFFNYVKSFVGNDYIKIFTQIISQEEYESLPDEEDN